MTGTLNSFSSDVVSGYSRVRWLSPENVSGSMTEGEKGKMLNAHTFNDPVNEVSRS